MLCNKLRCLVPSQDLDRFLEHAFRQVWKRLCQEAAKVDITCSRSSFSVTVGITLFGNACPDSHSYMQAYNDTVKLTCQTARYRFTSWAGMSLTLAYRRSEPRAKRPFINQQGEKGGIRKAELITCQFPQSEAASCGVDLCHLVDLETIREFLVLPRSRGLHRRVVMKKWHGTLHW